MSKLFLVTVITLSIFGGIFLGNNYLQQSSAPQAVSKASNAQIQGVTSSPEPAQQIEQKADLPITLSIPKINVNASIEYVGQDKEGKMDVPKIVANVAWYNLGPKPGEQGSSVLAGHFDDVQGRPAVFYNLSDLKFGDQIAVTDKNSKTKKFQVFKVQIYNVEQFPLEEVFAKEDGTYLNLITCDGVFNQSKNSYSQRLVVYSKLI